MEIIKGSNNINTEQTEPAHKQVLKESINMHIYSINKVINLYNNEDIERAKKLLGMAHDFILKGISANDEI